jgi:hypothetical protein
MWCGSSVVFTSYPVPSQPPTHAFHDSLPTNLKEQFTHGFIPFSLFHLFVVEAQTLRPALDVAPESELCENKGDITINRSNSLHGQNGKPPRGDKF